MFVAIVGERYLHLVFVLICGDANLFANHVSLPEYGSHCILSRPTVLETFDFAKFKNSYRVGKNSS